MELAQQSLLDIKSTLTSNKIELEQSIEKLGADLNIKIDGLSKQIKKLEKITDINHIFLDIEKDMRPPKKDLTDGRASGRDSKMSGEG